MRISKFMVGRWIIGALAVAVPGLTAASSADAAPKTEAKVAWSIYVGWMPWGFAAESRPERQPQGVDESGQDLRQHHA